MSNITTRQGFAPQTFSECRQFAEELASSSLVPKQYQGKSQDILVCVQWGMELGLAPMQALQNIAVINGKPSVYGDAALALVQASPVCEGVEETIEGEGTPNPTAVCTCHRKNRQPVTARFSVEDAKRAGLWGKQGPWQAYPKRMLQMRARGFALRDAFPDVLKGLITAEEAHDYPAERDVSPAKANPLDAIAPPVAPTELIYNIPAESVTAEMLEQVFDPEPVSQTAEELKAEFEEAGIEVVEVETMQELPSAAPRMYRLMVPGKAEPLKEFDEPLDFIKAYEDMAERTARAGKAPHRERMTKLRELREANEETLKKMPVVQRTMQRAAYSHRLAALGAAMKEADNAG